MGVVAEILQMDYMGSEIRGDKAVYKYMTTGIAMTTTELKAKILSILDWPIDIPSDITITEIKKGKIFKDYLVEIAVPREKIGKLKNLIAKKYGIIRHRPYSG